MSGQYSVIFDILWALSFNRDIQRQLRSDPKLMVTLTHLEHDLNSAQMRKITHGILWNLQSDHEDRTVSEKGGETTFDIMISYSHKDKEICTQLYNELVNAGYCVWIDFDQMHGNVMDAMAEAIERSKTILICMSEQYRRSNYCRAEAYYAFQRQLRIVPVLLEKHYKPDGWLLFLIGQLLYVDFTKYEFSQATEMLLKELKAPVTRGGIKNQPNVISSNLPLPLPTSVSVSPRISDDVQQWSVNDVQDWLMENNLTQISRLLSDFDGPSLINLTKYIINSNNSDMVLNLLQDDSLRRTHQNLSLVELSRFQTLINQQLQDIQCKTTKKKTKKTSNRHAWIRSNICKMM